MIESLTSEPDIVLCACSNKCVEVYDMNVGTRIRLMTDTHSRPVHAVCQNEVRGHYLISVGMAIGNGINKRN